MKKILCLTLLVALSIYSQAFAQEAAARPVIEFEGRYWMPELDGHAFVMQGGESTDIDFDNDLNLDEDNGSPGGRVTLNLWPHAAIRAGYMYMNFEGENTLSRNIVFDGMTYPATTNVDSEVTVHYFSLGWLWNFLHDEGSRFQAGLIIDIKGLHAKGSIDAAGIGRSEEDFTGAAPVPGLSMQINPWNSVGVFAEITGIPGGHYGHFFDAEGGLKWNMTRNFALSGGYRVIDVKVDYKDDMGRLKLKGPFAAATLSF